MNIKLSIVFVHYSTDDYKSEVANFCLRQLKRTLDETCELIIVNNGDRDEDFSKYADIYIKSDKNSLGYARNLGSRKATGKYICFMDNDVFVHPDWWRECITLLETFPDKKLIASPNYTSCHVFQRKYYAGMLGGHFLNKRSGSPCHLMKRETFDEIGDFLEKFGKYIGGEGGEFIDRFCKAGYLIILTRRMMAHHLGTKRYKYGKTKN